MNNEKIPSLPLNLSLENANAARIVVTSVPAVDITPTNIVLNNNLPKLNPGVVKAIL